MTHTLISHLPFWGGWEGPNMYIKPSIKVEEAMAAQMLAESLTISDDPVDGGEALTKENNSWDIWDEQ